MASQPIKPHKPARSTTRTLGVNTPALREDAEKTFVFWDFMREFDRAYQCEMIHNGWRFEARLPELALHAFRRLLRSHAVDVMVKTQPLRPSKSRSTNALNFKISLNTRMAREYGRQLKVGRHAGSQQPTAFIEGSESDLFFRAFQASLVIYGLEVSTPQLLPKRELPLIRVIDSTPPDATRLRYNELTARCADETLTKRERDELLKLVDVVECQHAERLKAVAKLSEIRKVSFLDMLKQFGLMTTEHE